MNQQNQWRIATSESGLARAYFTSIGIPIPDGFNYRDHSTRVSRYAGATGKHGYQNATIVWTKMTNLQATFLTTLVESARTSATGYGYFTIPRIDGLQYGHAWIDVYGYPDLSDISPNSPMYASGIIVNSVQLFINNIVILNNPAQT